MYISLLCGSGDILTSRLYLVLCTSMFEPSKVYARHARAAKMLERTRAYSSAIELPKSRVCSWTADRASTLFEHAQAAKDARRRSVTSVHACLSPGTPRPTCSGTLRSCTTLLLSADCNMLAIPVLHPEDLRCLDMLVERRFVLLQVSFRTHLPGKIGHW